MALISQTKGLLSKAHRKRYAEVMTILAKYGLDDFLATEKAQKIPLLTKVTKRDPKLADLSRWKRIRLAIEELDGAYIKLGQILSNRPDLLPEDLLTELENLQDNIPAFPGEKVIEIIETELKQPLGELFLMFDDEPLASASIAQVHRAVLLDGTPVVVKVRRPQLAAKFKIDLDILVYLAGHLKRIDIFKSQFKNSNPIKEIRYEIEKELDFINEAANINLFAKNFENDNRVYVPKVFSTLTTSKVLTLEYVDGIKVTNLADYEKYKLKPETIAYNLVDVGLTQMFDHRFFHGDPHPGNILLLENGKICFIDFGLMGRITSKQYETIIDLVIAFANKDEKKITQIIAKAAAKDKAVDTDKLESEISELIDIYYDQNLKEINVAHALKNVFAIINSYELTISPNAYLLVKAVSSYEGIGTKIYPDLELAEYAKHFSQKLIRRRLSPKKILTDVYMSSTEVVALIKDFPGELRGILNQLLTGRLRINAAVLGLREEIDYAFDRVEKVINRLLFTIILAAMLLGSSIILRNEDAIEFGNMSFFASIGFALSLVFGVVLLVTIIRNKGI